MPTYYGKYRGVVTQNADPDKRGRIKARVPAVLAEQESGWALPCVPYRAGRLQQRDIPPPGTPVWIEFEGGDLDQPIWSGRFWMARG